MTSTPILLLSARSEGIHQLHIDLALVAGAMLIFGLALVGMAAWERRPKDDHRRWSETHTGRKP